MLEEKNFIKKYWDSQGEKYEDSHVASWGDNHMIDLEINLISSFIKKDQKILDAGCANGFSTFKQFEKFNKNIDITGIDFSESLIKFAKKKKNNIFSDNNNINFFVNDIRNINFPDNYFDLSYTTRTIINLDNWEEQKKGIDELIRVTAKGGKVLLLEGCWEPLALLNSVRLLFKLSPLEEHDFNRYIKIKRLREYLDSKKIKFEQIDFSSVYYLGSRFVRELVTDIDKYEGYSNPINKIFADLEKDYSGGSVGVQQAFLLYI